MRFRLINAASDNSDRIYKGRSWEESRNMLYAMMAGREKDETQISTLPAYYDTSAGYHVCNFREKQTWNLDILRSWQFILIDISSWAWRGMLLAVGYYDDIWMNRSIKLTNRNYSHLLSHGVPMMFFHPYRAIISIKTCKGRLLRDHTMTSEANFLTALDAKSYLYNKPGSVNVLWKLKLAKWNSQLRVLRFTPNFSRFPKILILWYYITR